MSTTHGESDNGKRRPSPEYSVWGSMLTRCRNHRSRAFKRYGACGITVSSRWLRYENFLEDMGRRPTKRHSLDRIKNEHGYTKSNCRWASPVEQARNKTSNRIITIAGEAKTLAEWVEVYHQSYQRVWDRIVIKGWTPLRALTEPVPGPIAQCKRGHPLSGENMRLEGTSRRCKTCKKEYDRTYRLEMEERGLKPDNRGLGLEDDEQEEGDFDE